jgi:transitional endoplasmic reticulum ATPase
MANAEVMALPENAVSYGHCYSNVAGLTGGELVEIESTATTIFCRVAWDISELLDAPSQVALDRWQCASLGSAHGQSVQVSVRNGADIPLATSVELMPLHGAGESEHTLGIRDFLSGGHYVLYPGLQFAYRPLAGADVDEYVVVRVRTGELDVELAALDRSVDVVVRPALGTRSANPGYGDLGGLDDVVALLRRDIELPLRRPTHLRQIGVLAPAGVLLCGPPGIGKTLLARAVAARCEVDVIMLSGPSLVSQPRADVESALRAALRTVEPGAQPRLVIIDDLDYLAPGRDVPGAPVSYLGVLQELLDQTGRPVVLATTSKPDDIDPQIRRLGRLGRQVQLPLPADDDRRAILEIHTRDLALEAKDDTDRSELLRDLAARTSGFVGADLAELCHEAGRIALRRAFPVDVLESEDPRPAAPLTIAASDWLEALTFVTPSALGRVVTETPQTTFADVAGLDATVRDLRERLVMPLQNPELFAEAGLRVERGILLYGPPGTGKTLLARAIANECGRRYLSVRGPELLNQWFGESERAVRDIFEKARNFAPSILFFDEIDALVPRRSGGTTDGGAANRVVNQVLGELDGLQDLGQVTVIGATNNAKRIDPAALRPGRLGLHIEVPLPDTAGRRSLLRLYLPDGWDAAQIDEYAAQSEGMAGADVAMVAREAKLAALRRGGFAHLVQPEHGDVIIGLDRVRDFNRRQSIDNLLDGGPW